MYLPLPSRSPAGSFSDAPWKKPTLTCAVKALTYANGASSTHTTGHPSCSSSRTSGPQRRICSNHRRAMEPSAPGRESNHQATAGSCASEPQNRKIGYTVRARGLAAPTNGHDASVLRVVPEAVAAVGEQFDVAARQARKKNDVLAFSIPLDASIRILRCQALGPGCGLDRCSGPVRLQ